MPNRSSTSLSKSSSQRSTARTASPGNGFLQYLNGQERFLVCAAPRRSSDKRTALLPLPVAQAPSQLFQKPLTLALGDAGKGGYGIRQQPDLRRLQEAGQQPISLAVILILRDVAAHGSQLVQGGVHRPPVTAQAVLAAPHGQGVVPICMR